MIKWTDGRKKGFITSVLRAGFRKFPPKYSALKKAAVGKKMNPVSKRMAEHYECNACKKHYVGAKVQVDHKIPIVDPTMGFTGWEDFIDRLFCGEENLQILCIECHKRKSSEENKKRNVARKSRK